MTLEVDERRDVLNLLSCLGVLGLYYDEIE